MNILGISGSLREASVNSALLRAMARWSQPPVQVSLYGGLARLAPFNPDLDSSPPPDVVGFQTAVDSSDALIIASPEYAHGPPGVLKNALDWLVGYAPFHGKPIAVLNTSARASHADAAIRETLKTMAAHIVESASLTIPLAGTGLHEDAILATPWAVESIRYCLWSLKEEQAG